MFVGRVIFGTIQVQLKVIWLAEFVFGKVTDWSPDNEGRATDLLLVWVWAGGTCAGASVSEEVLQHNHIILPFVPLLVSQAAVESNQVLNI